MIKEQSLSRNVVVDDELFITSGVAAASPNLKQKTGKRMRSQVFGRNK